MDTPVVPNLSLLALEHETEPVSIRVRKQSGVVKDDTVLREGIDDFLTDIPDEEILVGFATIRPAVEPDEKSKVTYYLGINELIVSAIDRLILRTISEPDSFAKIESDTYSLEPKFSPDGTSFQIEVAFGQWVMGRFVPRTSPLALHRVFLKLEGGKGEIVLGSSVFNMSVPLV